MTHLAPGAEPWRGFLRIPLPHWRATVYKVDPNDERPGDTTALIVWQCEHRHDDETSAEKCAADHIGPPRRREEQREPRPSLLELLFGKPLRLLGDQQARGMVLGR